MTLELQSGLIILGFVLAVILLRKFKVLGFIVLSFTLTGCPSGNEKFNPGLPSVDDGVEIPEDTIDAVTDATDDIIDIPVDTIPEVPEKPKDSVVTPEVPKDTIVKPEKPSTEYILKEAFSGEPKEIPANDKNSLVNNSKDQPFTLRAYLNIKDFSGLQWIASKRDKESNEWQLMIYQDQLVFALTEKGDYKPNSIARALPLSEVPTGYFLLHIEYDGNYSTSGFTWTVNGREVETNHLWDSTYKGMTKSNASVFIGKAGFNDNYPFKGTAEISIAKGLSTPEKKLEDYKETFGVESIFAKPAKDGNYYIDVEPNTGEDVSIALNKAIDNIPDGTPGKPSQIKLKSGRYNVDRKHIPGYIEGGAIDLYARRNLRFSPTGDEPVVLYVTDAAVPPFEMQDNQTNRTGKRNQIRGQRCENIEIYNFRIESTNKEKSFKGYLEFEHAISFKYSKNITVKKYVADGCWGDGFYAWHTDGINLIDVETYNINRQGLGFSNGCKNILIDNHTADKMTRTAVDLEPQSGGLIDNVEIRNSTWYDGHLAAGGAGYVNNVHFHNNKHRAAIRALGGLSYPRENWTIENNEIIGSYGSPMPFVQVRVTKNVTVKNNKYSISPAQKKFAVLLQVCSGNIEITGNDFDIEARVELVNTDKDSKITIENNKPEPLITIDYE
ncbi:right-handed parallel beta-helix repeat-containing protein [Christiangramia forsetii]|uniref:Right handed beta helix domain-containing protein n=2 Tax=Christiangramia forsetii TaxID=411153 RepID=A0M431_CHRFK|nr:right-handed parallel beta-helix repeat-containing protein [Christiangramia forsetii]GGG24362.1 hypothetical protein GCM10011532_04520 [Christiangramia forsetii]CAL67376.1 conserved hypothetical protein [Christiangramia forsetii KT0803]